MRGRKVNQQRKAVQLNESAVQFFLLIYALKKFAKHKNFVNLLFILMAILAVLPLARANSFSGEDKRRSNNSTSLPFESADTVVTNNGFSFFNNTCPVRSAEQPMVSQSVKQEEYKPVSYSEKLTISDKKVVSQQNKNSGLFDVRKQKLEKEILEKKNLPQKVANYVKKIPVCEEYKKNFKKSSTSAVSLFPAELENKIRAELRSLLLEPLYRPLLDNEVIFPIDIDPKQAAPAYTMITPKFKMTLSLKAIEQMAKYPNLLRSLLANELYHLSIAENNNNLYEINVNNEVDLLSPYTGITEMATFMSKTKSSLKNLFLNINFSNYDNDKKIFIRNSMTNIATYNLKFTSEFREIFLQRNIISSEELSYINQYGQLHHLRQLYELSSDVATLLVLLNKKDRAYFEDWIKYHIDFYKRTNSDKFLSQTIK